MTCYHCGEDCLEETIAYDERSFCCSGCKTVYEILNASDLSYYYELEKSPGTSPKLNEGKFDYLDKIHRL